MQDHQLPGLCMVVTDTAWIYASRDFNREGGPHLTLEFGDTEVLHLSPMMRPSRSAPTSPSSSRAPSLHGSPRLSNRRLSVGSITPSMAGSYDADSMRLSVRRSNTVTPLTLTHSRVTSTQFAGAPRNRPRSRSRSRSPSWSPLPLPFPSRSRSPSPSRSLYNFHPQSSTHDVVPNPQDTSDGYRRGDFLGEILISPPSRSQTLELSR
ncbi:hypothetical protein H4582DRAFT_521529 [Lactarius indigo]|nr:hypothetical protein H4582DRAFT_521529 [Lactarius indigo]